MVLSTVEHINEYYPRFRLSYQIRWTWRSRCASVTNKENNSIINFLRPGGRQVIKRHINWNQGFSFSEPILLSRSTSNCVFPGYGMRTLCELASDADFDSDRHWNRCGNIMDYFACYLTGSDKVFMSEANAYCWGYSTGLRWNSEILPFTPKWIKLPEIVRTDVGTGVPIGVAIADLHGSITSVRGNIIIGTSSQLCFVLSNSLSLPTMPITTHIFPFTEGLTLLAAASMNGGNTLDAFISVSSSQLKNNTQASVPEVKPLFTAERGSQDTGVEIHGLKPDTTLIQALVQNLFALVPTDLLTSYGVKKLFLVGSAKKDRFRVHIERYLQKHRIADQIELIYAETDTSAAYGVAL
ncbi:unnamed protein product [Haemonchus placei]|uniref:FGGY_N domain-containing protein n=1 Tax=Haemonchus placei TaxID=6290 RepID=A0A0N4W6R2_HAEPC|nr:unnamed protein product [Haemonchus placei]